MPQERSYKAFISYRHRPLDKQAAEMIEKRIENYRVPKDLQAQAGGKKLGYVFRDEDELPISSSLSDSITQALDHTEFLIVICTPDLPKSKWCEQEIKYFLKTHDRDHLLAVLADGTPDESFSPWMLHEYDEGGNVTADLEPLAANIAGENHTISRKAFTKESMRILAALIGCPFDTLWQRERRARTTRLMTGLGIVAAALAVFLGVVLNKNAQITRQNRQITEQNSQITAQNAQISAQNAEITQHNRDLMQRASSLHVDAGFTALEKFDRKTALSEALSALESGDEALYDQRASRLMAEAMELYVRNSISTSVAFTQPTAIRRMALTADGSRLVTMDRSYYLRVFDTATGELLWENISWDPGTIHSGYQEVMYLAEDQDRIVLSNLFGARGVSLSDGTLAWSVEWKDGGTALAALSPDGSLLAATEGADREDGTADIVFVNTSDGSAAGRVTIGSEESRFVSDMLGTHNGYGASFTEDGRYFLCGVCEEFAEENEEGRTGHYRYYQIDVAGASVVRDWTGEAFSNSASTWYGLFPDESTGDVLAAHHSQYAGKLYTVICHADGTVETQSTDHLQTGFNGLRIAIGEEIEAGMLTSDHLAVIYSQKTLFVFDRATGKLRKGIEMNDRILEASWYDRENEILAVMLADGTYVAYALEHTDNKLYSSADYLELKFSGLTQAISENGGPAYNVADGRWYTVREEAPGTVLVCRGVSDPDITTLYEAPSGTSVYEAEVLASPDGRTVFALARDSESKLTVTVLSADTLTQTGQFVCEGKAYSAAAAALDAEHIAVGVRIYAADGTWEYFEGVTDKTAETLGSSGAMLQHASGPDGTVYTCAMDGGQVRLWVNGKTFVPSAGEAALAFDAFYGLWPGGSGLVTVYGAYGEEGLGFVTFDLKDGTVTVTKDAHPEQDLKKVIPGNAADVFAVADMSGMLTVYAVKAGTHTDMNASYTFDEIRAVAFSPDDKYLIVLNHSERLDIFDAASGDVVFSETVDGVFGDRFDGSDRKIVCRQDEGTGELFLAVRTGSSSDTGYMIVLNTDTWQETGRMPRVIAADPKGGLVFRFSGRFISAFPWRTLEDLKAMAEERQP